MLGEAATTEITHSIDAHGFDENLSASRQGGEVAGKAREDLEKKSGKKVSTGNNYLTEPQGKKLTGKKK